MGLRWALTSSMLFSAGGSQVTAERDEARSQLYRLREDYAQLEQVVANQVRS